MKLDDRSEFTDVIKDMKRERKLLLFSRGSDWWLLLPPRRVKFDRSDESRMQIISSSTKEMPSETSMDYFDLHYEYPDTYLGINRKGRVLISMQTYEKELPIYASLEFENYTHIMEPKNNMKLTAIERTELPIYIKNPREICEIILKRI